MVLTQEAIPAEGLARCFVGFELSAAHRAGIAAWARALAAGNEGILWTAEPDLHLTLVFLGEADRKALMVLAARLEESARVRHPFWLRLGGLDAFPDKVHPAVWWASVREGMEAVASSAAAVRAAASSAGFPIEPRPFVPHVTLGRTRKETSGHSARFPEDPAEIPADNGSLISAFTLFQSLPRRGSTDPHYYPILRFPFQDLA